MGLIINWLVSAAAIFISAYILEGVSVDSFVTALIVALVLGVINAFIKPILLFFTLPINILTLGLFTLVINAVLIQLTAFIVEGFSVDNFVWALLFSLVLTVINYLLHLFLPSRR